MNSERWTLIFHMSIPCDKTFQCLPLFFTLWTWPLSLTYFLKTLILLITFEQWMLELWYFSWIFLVIRSFCWYYTFWPWHFTFFWIDINHYFEIMNNRAFILHMSISCDNIFLLVSRYLFLWPWSSIELAIIGGIYVSETHLFLGLNYLICVAWMITISKCWSHIILLTNT